MKYDCVLIEKPCAEPMSREDIEKMLSMLDIGEGVYPLDIPGNNSMAMGFITAEASKTIGYRHEELEDFLMPILSDMDKENESGQYFYKSVGIYMGRSL